MVICGCRRRRRRVPQASRLHTHPLAELLQNKMSFFSIPKSARDVSMFSMRDKALALQLSSCRAALSSCSHERSPWYPPKRALISVVLIFGADQESVPSRYPARSQCDQAREYESAAPAKRSTSPNPATHKENAGTDPSNLQHHHLYQTVSPIDFLFETAVQVLFMLQR